MVKAETWNKTLIRKKLISQTNSDSKIDLFEPSHEKKLFMPYTNNKDAHPCTLIGVFVICCLDSIIPIVVISRVPKRLASLSVAEQASLSFTCRFSHDVTHLLIDLEAGEKSDCFINFWFMKLTGADIYCQLDRGRLKLKSAIGMVILSEFCGKKKFDKKEKHNLMHKAVYCQCITIWISSVPSWSICSSNLRRDKIPRHLQFKPP